MKKRNRILAAVLTVLLILTLLPVNCFAAEGDIPETPVITDLFVDNCTVYNGIDGFYFEDDFYYTYSPSFRLVLSDGRYFTASAIDDTYGVVIDGTTYFLEFVDTQDVAFWDIGKHTVNATLLNKTVEFTVEVMENPVSKVEFKDTFVYENFNCYQDLLYDEETGEPIDIFKVYCYSAEASVYFKDGTKQDTVGGAITYNGTEYYVEVFDFQYEELWGLGENTAYVSLFGFEDEITVTIKENPYITVAIDEMLNLALEREDGSVEQYVVSDIIPEIYIDVTMMIGKLITDKGIIPGAFFYYSAPPKTQVMIGFGEYLSNYVESTFFGVQASSTIFTMGAYGYRNYSEKYLDKVFTGYNKSDADYDENALATMSILSFTEIYDYLEDIIEKNGNVFVVLQADVVKDLVEKQFGISGFDKTKLFGYSASDGTAEVLLCADANILNNGDIQPDGDGYDVVIELYEAYLSDFDAIEMEFDADGYLTSVAFAGDKTGLAIEKIEVADAPVKRNYAVGDSFNAINGAQGMTLNVTYEDGSEKVITGGFTFGELVAEERGETEIEVFYGGKSTTFGVKVLSGDADGNGVVNVSDLAFLKKIIAGIVQPDADELAFADIDLNGGVINVADLATLKKMIAGLDF